MSGISGMNVLGNLRQKMQSLRDELEKYKDLYDEKCHELERERSVKNEVRDRRTFIGEIVKLQNK